MIAHHTAGTNWIIWHKPSCSQAVHSHWKLQTSYLFVGKVQTGCADEFQSWTHWFISREGKGKMTCFLSVDWIEAWTMSSTLCFTFRLNEPSPQQLPMWLPQRGFWSVWSEGWLNFLFIYSVFPWTSELCRGLKGKCWQRSWLSPSEDCFALDGTGASGGRSLSLGVSGQAILARARPCIGHLPKQLHKEQNQCFGFKWITWAQNSNFFLVWVLIPPPSPSF